MLSALSREQILELWERGAQRHPLDRALLLMGSARPGDTLHDLADVSVGQRDQTLIALRCTMFGRELSGYVDCPACKTRLEFVLDAESLRSDASDAVIDVDGLRIRCPTSRDLASVMSEPNPEYRLAQRCCATTDGEPPLLSPAQVLMIESALAEADAAADIVLDFSCEQCDIKWQTAFDIGDYLWREIEAQAARLLADIHTLARAYGWSEREVLALSDTRRAAYIDRVLA